MGLEPQAWERELQALHGCRRIGVYGGTFDPVHVGHLIVAEEVACAIGLDRVLFVPARMSPLKQDAEAVPTDDRLEMVRLAIADNPRFAVSQIDISREGPSYTVDTLQMLSEALPGTELFFVMGMDSLATFGRWREPERILAMARIVVVSRPGCDIQFREACETLPPFAGHCALIDTLQIGISSTDIRQRVRTGQPIRYQVPAAVERYILAHQLYLETGASPTLANVKST